MKAIVPGWMKKVLRRYRERPAYNVFDSFSDRKALLSYVVTPFRSSGKRHTNAIEVIAAAEILGELGYRVDVIDYLHVPKIDITEYDAVYGFGDIFQEHFENPRANAKTIYYGTGMHVCVQNRNTLQRVKNVKADRGVWIGKSARYVEKSWTHQTQLVDGIIAVGGAACADTYRTFYNGPIYGVPVPYFETCDAIQVISNRVPESRKHFLWFGSAGLIHKGLDLCLEFFSKRPELTLHVCGNIAAEQDFENEYAEELYRLPNIRTHGWIDIEDDQFTRILSRCDYVIMPSCSEGGGASVITAIANGGLIPIVSPESTVATGNEVTIPELTLEGVTEAVEEALSYSDDVRLRKQYANLEYVKSVHSVSNYTSLLTTAIGEIL